MSEPFVPTGQFKDLEARVAALEALASAMTDLLVEIRKLNTYIVECQSKHLDLTRRVIDGLRR